MPSAVRGGSTEMLAWLLQRGCTLLTTALTEVAVSAGHLHVLRYLREHGCEWQHGCCKAAAKRGDVAMLRYLCDEGCPMDERACEAAVAARKPEALRLLRERGCPWDASATTSAAISNNADMLQYLHEHDCMWVEVACTAAARNSNLSMLQYLRQHGCPWSAAAVASSAVASGSTQLVSWLLQQPGIAFDPANMLTAAEKGHTAICQLLRAAQIPYSDTCASAQLGAGIARLCAGCTSTARPGTALKCASLQQRA
jgi:hypothetical protein